MGVLYDIVIQEKGKRDETWMSVAWIRGWKQYDLAHALEESERGIGVGREVDVGGYEARDYESVAAYAIEEFADAVEFVPTMEEDGEKGVVFAEASGALALARHLSAAYPRSMYRLLWCRH
jgi:hypothetical protein